MNEQHITGLEIKNFKKFDTLVVDNIGQVNLITGDNNVGKTTLLEAIVVIQPNDVDKSILHLHQTLYTKGLLILPQSINAKNVMLPKENYFSYIKNNEFNKKIEFRWTNKKYKHSMSFEDCLLETLTETDFKKRKIDNYNVANQNYWIKIYIDDEYQELQWMYFDNFRPINRVHYWELVAFNQGYGYDLSLYYRNTIGIDEPSIKKQNNIIGQQLELQFKELDYKQKQSFIDTLSLFIPDIQDTTIKNYFGLDMLSIKAESFHDYQPISIWGDGFNKFVRYLLEIIQCKGKKLLIDEIDTGVHWTKLKEVWKNIIKSCQVNDVQLFCTTHSQECIKAFIEAAEEVEEMKSKIRLIELETGSKNKDRVYANTHEFGEIKSSLESKINVRGGNLYV